MADILELMSSHKLGLAFSVDFPFMILTSLAYTFYPPSLGLDSRSSAWCLVVDLCIWCHQLQDGKWMKLENPS